MCRSCTKQLHVGPTQDILISMVLELYFDMLSEPSRAVYLFVKAAEVPFEPKVVSLMKD